MSITSWTQKQNVREFLAEFIGSFLLVGIGDAACASFILRNKGRPDLNDPFNISFCWGVSVMVAVTASASISGAHLNPAITVAQAVFKNFSWKKVPHYLAAQYLGSFVASCVVYILYFDALEAFDDGQRLAYGGALASGGVWATYPSAALTIRGAAVDQIISTAFLMICILVITDAEGLNIPSNIQPLYLCFTITVLCTAFGTNCGAALNPCRDLAPRIFTALAGWGWEPFEPLNGHYWWVGGVAGPHIGAIVGAGVFYLTIGLNRKAARNYDVTGDKELDSKDEMQVIATKSVKEPTTSI